MITSWVLFHFSQCIFRRIQSDGLKRRYETDFALKLRLLSALAFVPTADVVEAFETICEQNVLPAEAHSQYLIIMKIPGSGVHKEVDDVCPYFHMICGIVMMGYKKVCQKQTIS